MFLFISSFIWFLISLSDNYISHVTFNLNYMSIPEDKLVLGKPKKNITVDIEASGFKILNYRIFRRELNLPLDNFKEKKGDHFYMLPAQVENVINNQYKSLVVRKMNQDSLLLDLGVNKKKYIKVDPDIHFEFAEDHQLKDSLRIQPDSIWVRGPEDLVKKIKEVTTEKGNYNNVKGSFEYVLPLKIPDSVKELEFETKRITISGTMERYSERIILVPVQVQNLPENTTLKLYPDKVKLICKAPISQLKNINENGFKVVCDYNDIQKNSAVVIPRLVEKPKYVTSVKMLDMKLEFLIKKQ
ncbi:CdaR family protein [Galbibacter mesophilus]|uniref:CdaR family protein n=1 Tax=Galbibacter mesophilus TaxID=379069 RepID=UPI001F5CFAC2|nr:CdaR family protein [Galbibacter mesophilus]MCM5662781.1 CdaR family protein [Galbibacter mesophilus]